MVLNLKKDQDFLGVFATLRETTYVSPVYSVNSVFSSESSERVVNAFPILFACAMLPLI